MSVTKEKSKCVTISRLQKFHNDFDTAKSLCDDLGFSSSPAETKDWAKGKTNFPRLLKVTFPTEFDAKKILKDFLCNEIYINCSSQYVSVQELR